jgi:uncharacterized protein
LTRWPPPQSAVLPGGRLHLQHGPIDLVIKAEGHEADLRRAYMAGQERFQSILGELAGELPHLRRRLVGDVPPALDGPVARRMVAACWPHRHVFITPMAAVAGAVADEMKAAMLAAAPHLETLYVNNGGDIALHVASGCTLRIGLVPDLVKAVPEGVLAIRQESGIGGVATSGWRGRSFSLGIADAATVLATTAAQADAAATMIGNAVTVDDPAVRQRPAQELDPDSDLGITPVTVDVGVLSGSAIAVAMAHGIDAARRLHAEGCAAAVLVALRGQIAVWPGEQPKELPKEVAACKNVFLLI